MYDAGGASIHGTAIGVGCQGSHPCVTSLRMSFFSLLFSSLCFLCVSVGHRSHARVGDTSDVSPHVGCLLFCVVVQKSHAPTPRAVLPRPSFYPYVLRRNQNTRLGQLHRERCKESPVFTSRCILFADGVVTVRVAGAIFTCFTWRRRGRRGRRRRRRRGVRSHEDNHRIHAVVCPRVASVRAREDTEDEDGLCGG
jgi:hypothetical protein